MDNATLSSIEVHTGICSLHGWNLLQQSFLLLLFTRHILLECCSHCSKSLINMNAVYYYYYCWWLLLFLLLNIIVITTIVLYSTLSKLPTRKRSYTSPYNGIHTYMYAWPIHRQHSPSGPIVGQSEPSANDDNRWPVGADVSRWCHSLNSPSHGLYRPPVQNYSRFRAAYVFDDCSSAEVGIILYLWWG